MAKIPRHKKKSRKSTKQALTTDVVKKMVKAEVHRNIEDKVINYDDGISALWPVASASFANNNIFALTPQTSHMTVLQGVGQPNRIGNRVKTRRAILKYIIYPSPYDVTSNPNPTPIDVQVFIFSLKPNVDTYANAQSIATNSFFQSGSSSTGFASTVIDLLQDVNQDQVTIHYRKIHKVGFALNAGSGAIAAYQNWANNDYKYNAIKKVDITKFYTKNLEFNDTTTTTTSRGLYMIVSYAPAYGGVPTTTSSLAFLEWQMDYYFEDA